ncbi:MAG TPA: hypothetical protein VNN17_07490 [Terriglobia bacterium]|nr:hypothetical protein [Terriglobia bacterium]
MELGISLHKSQEACAVPAPSGGRALDPLRAESKITAHLQGIWKAEGMRVVLGMPASPASSASQLVANIARVLAHTTAPPVLVIDIHHNPPQRTAASILCREKVSEFVTDLGVGRQVAFLSAAEVPKIVVARLAQNEFDPLGFLASEQFLSLLSYSRDRFAYTLIDGPSPLQSATSMVVAPHCDGCVLVVEEGVSQYSELQTIKKMLAQTRTHLLGFVFQAAGKKRSRQQS